MIEENRGLQLAASPISLAEAHEIIKAQSDRLKQLDELLERRQESAKRMEKALAIRLRYEEGLAACSKILLSDAKEALDEVLARLLETAAGSRVQIYRNFDDPHDGLCMRRTHQVCAPGLETSIDKFDRRHKPYKNGFARWKDKLANGDIIAGPVDSFPGSEREYLESQGILWLLALPIRAAEKWIGFISFENTQRQPKWSGEDTRLLQTAADMIGSYIERMRAGQKHRLLEKAVETMKLGVTITDLEGTIIYVNPAEAESHGYSSEELLGRKAQVFAPPQQWQQLSLKEICRVTERKRISINIRRDGTVFPVQLLSDVVRNESDEPIGFVTTCEDITERTKTEEALRVSEIRYRSFFEEDLTGDYIATVDGQILDCNVAFAKIFGFSSLDEALHSNLLSLCSDKTAHQAFLEQLTIDKKLEYYETEWRSQKGDPVFIVKNASGKFDDQNRLIEIKGYVFDITPHKKLEAELRQIQKMEAIGQLAGGIAHDFNNYLSSIILHASLIKRKSSENELILKYADSIHKTAHRAADLINQILAFARKGKHLVQTIGIHNIIEEALNIISKTIDRSIEIETSLDDHLPNVDGDPTQLLQIVMNLCINASYAMPNGGKLIIETERQNLNENFCLLHPGSKPGDYTLISIRDTGVGMDSDTCSRIFEPFFTTKPLGQGTGMGLATVYGIVKNHNGYIHVYSELGNGAEFKVYLPVSEKEQAEKEKTHEDKLLPGSETILIADDNEPLLQGLRHILNTLGYKTLTAGNGQEAVELYKRRKSEIDLVIMDISMPVMSGKEAFFRLRNINRQVKIIVFSGYSQNEVVQNLLDAGAKDFIQKPFAPEALIEKIRAIFD